MKVFIETHMEHDWGPCSARIVSSSNILGAGQFPVDDMAYNSYVSFCIGIPAFRV
jgi:hypothetical protein